MAVVLYDDFDTPLVSYSISRAIRLKEMAYLMDINILNYPSQDLIPK
jgi:hypothetical protein